MVGVSGGLSQIGELWDRCGKQFEGDRLVSADPEVMACAYSFPREGAVVYVAGVPASDTTPVPEGFTRIDVPGGEYVLVHHYGPYSELASIPDPLAEAVKAVGRTPTADWLELYRPLGPNGETLVELGWRLSATDA
jgi:predicted transcriptional regulator YdeE